MVDCLICRGFPITGEDAVTQSGRVESVGQDEMGPLFVNRMDPWRVPIEGVNK